MTQLIREEIENNSNKLISSKDKIEALMDEIMMQLEKMEDQMKNYSNKG